jgi:choline dehydrogenase-like flavoprotein
MSAAFDADIVIIGSGPAGVSVAFPLVKAGRRVLMIDGARSAGRVSAEQIKPWQKLLGAHLEALLPEDGLSPKLRAPTSRVMNSEFQRVGAVRGEGFVVTGAYARGGLSQVWGGFACEFDAEDLVNWPFSVDDLLPSYKAVTERIGISGSLTDDMARFYGRSGALLPPLSLGPTVEQVFKRYEARRRAENFALGAARNAILTADCDGRKACNLGMDCLWGCERGAVYDARFDLATLESCSGFQIVDDALAVGLTPCKGGWEIYTKNGRQFRTPRVALAAGALSTASLVLPLFANCPQGLRLLSNPVMAMPFVVPRRLWRAAPNKGHSLAQLGYRLRDGTADFNYVTGAIYEVAFLPTSSFAYRLPFGSRAGIEFFSALAPSLLVATVYFSGEYSDNTIWLERQGDRHFISIRGGFLPSLPDKVSQIRYRLRKILRQLGAWLLPGSSLAAPGTDVHFGGPFSMGLERLHGTSAYGELHAASGIFVVDGGAFPSMPAKYPTLSIMANADRIGHYLAKL